jgi:PPPDE putative peptidase domain
VYCDASHLQEKNHVCQSLEPSDSIQYYLTLITADERTMQQNDSRVQLLVYDLSRGMAATLSQQILGQRIDGIWHTGIQIFGVEYFFGGGIQSSPAGIFAQQHQMPPVRILELGQTQKSQTELRAFLQSIHNRFNASTYDLTRNNCNNFSDTVSQFLVGKSLSRLTFFQSHLNSMSNIENNKATLTAQVRGFRHT